MTKRISIGAFGVDSGLCIIGDPCYAVPYADVLKALGIDPPGPFGKDAPQEVWRAALTYALALPDGPEWLSRWYAGDVDAVLELESTMPATRKETPPAVQLPNYKGVVVNTGGDSVFEVFATLDSDGRVQSVIVEFG